MALLGLDLGTSSVKAVLFDPDSAAILGVASQEYPLDKPSPEKAEQNPETWWQATIQVVRQVVADNRQHEITAIGFSGQMHGTVFIDQHGQIPHPAIIWADQRSAAQVSALTDSVGQKRYLALTGTLPAAGFMGATLLWLRQHQPDLLKMTAKVILPKDYIRFRMTGKLAADFSDAASTGLFDIIRRIWAAEILNAVDLSAELFPPLLDSFAIAGELQASAARELGLKAGIAVIMGCADQPAQALGNGIIAPGKASVTIGSGGQVFVPLRANPLPTDARLHVFNHAVPETWYILGAILSAGLSLRWLRQITGLANTPHAYEILSAEASQVPAGANGLIFLPYLSGERTPHMDALARGAFIGLSHYHERGHLARAVMEGVTFALRQALEISFQLGGQVETVIAAGGAAESPFWRQLQADIFGLPVQKSLLTESAGLGAALLAGVGSDIYPDFDTACQQVVRYDSPVEPRNYQLYAEIYAHFCELYPRLRTDFHQLAVR